MPRKVFVAGEILTAADVNTNLMDQSVMVFDDATARTTAIPTPVEGMVTYLKDANQVSAFDGSAFELVGVEPGLAFISSTTFSGVSAQSFNDVFTSEFDNYKVLFVGSAGASVSVSLRLRVAGSDAAGADYVRQRIFANGTSLTASRATGQTGYLPGNAGDGPDSFDFDILRPALAASTVFHNSNHFVFTAPNSQSQFNTGFHSLGTAFDGFTIFPSSSTITGTVEIYGYRKA